MRDFKQSVSFVKGVIGSKKDISDALSDEWPRFRGELLDILERIQEAKDEELESLVKEILRLGLNSPAGEIFKEILEVTVEVEVDLDDASFYSTDGTLSDEAAEPEVPVDTLRQVSEELRLEVRRPDDDVRTLMRPPAPSPPKDAARGGWRKITRFGKSVRRKMSERWRSGEMAEAPKMDAEETGPPAKERVVNTNFADPEHPDKALDKKTPLKSGASYFFCLDIGEYRDDSMEETPVDIPEVPAEAKLTVALFSFEDGLEITPGADVGELKVRGDGQVVVVCQPLAESSLLSKHLEKRLFFPVRAPDVDGVFRMRCNIYCEQLLLQSRVIVAHVMRQPQRLKGEEQALTSELDYTLSQRLDPKDLTQLARHKLSILLNDNDDGTHSFHVLGSDDEDLFKSEAVRFGEGELNGMINIARERLRLASWGEIDRWQSGRAFKYSDRQRDLDRLRADLFNLAQWGYEFYNKVIARLAGGEYKVKDLEKIMAEPGFVQIALKQSPSYIVPAALIYDYRILTNQKGYSLCPSFEEAFHRNTPLAEHECFLGRCPSRGQLKTICPSGFWGFRHNLGLPLSNSKEDLVARITYEKEIEIVVGAATNMDLITAHRESLLKLRPKMAMNFADTGDEVFDALKKSPHIVYFYCHGGYVGGALFLQVGSDERIMESHFRALDICWADPRPLVFLNGCHTTAADPMNALSFFSTLLEYSKSAGVIGSEITIYEEMATTFAEECFREFLNGEAIGKAIRSARLKLLSEGNPLGLVYIPFVQAGLSLKQQNGK